MRILFLFFSFNDTVYCCVIKIMIWVSYQSNRSVRVVQWLESISGSNPVGGGIQLMTILCFIARSLPASPFRRLDMSQRTTKPTRRV